MINSVNYTLCMHDYRFNINNEAKISIDNWFKLGYNDGIKNEIGGQPNPFALTEKRNETQKSS